MTLSRHEEEAFQALTRELRPRGMARFPRWLTFLVSVACIAAIVLANFVDAPWLALAGWLGLIFGALAGTARAGRSG